MAVDVRLRLFFGLMLLASAAGCGVSPPIPLAATDLELSSAASSAVEATAAIEVDSALPSYDAAPGLTGRLTFVGSDSMNNLLALWAESFKRYHPQVEIEVEAKGSSTAIPALVAGAATFGPMSRDLKPKEIDEFEARFGYKPIQLATAVDMVAVYVHRDNPLRELTLGELDAMFSKTRKLGEPHDIAGWGQVVAAGPWRARNISLYGRNASSGTYGFFKDKVLGGGDFKDSVKAQPGSSSVVQGVGSDPTAIGYSGIGYRTADVRTLALAPNAGETSVPAEPRFAYSGEYPLWRYLWLTVNYAPGSQLPPLSAAFVRYVLSRQGQEEVIRDGYLPLDAETAARFRSLVHLDSN
ncbi:MAG: PstS family phosphate ABC transporter substrate-binding protein [Pirellulales bacterium]